MTDFLLECLPIGVLDRIGLYLDDKSIAMISTTSKFFREKFPITRLEPSTSIQPQRLTGRNDDGDDFFQMIMIPMTYPCSAMRTLRLRCVWWDQGWGNRKGQVAIIASQTHNELPTQIQERDLNIYGRLVCYTSESAGHHAENLVLTFTPQPNWKYYLYMKAGGGGGHQLHLEDMFVQRIIFDNPDWSISRSFRILSDLRVIGPVRNSPFLHGLLQSTVASMLQQCEKAQSSDIAKYIRSHGLLIDDPSSLEAIQDLLANHQP